MIDNKILVQTDSAAVLKAPQKHKKDPGASKIFKVIVYVLLSIYLLWVVAPFLIIFLTSFISSDEIHKTLSFVWWPKEGFTLDAYKTIFVDDYLKIGAIPSLLRGLFNTLWITIPTMVISLFVSGLAAYAYSKLQFKGKNVMYMITLAVMMLPMSVMTIPSYVMYDTIGWTNSPLPLIIPGMFGGAVTIFFFRQFFASIPNELMEAAKLDGLGYFSIYVQIVLPLSKVAFMAQAIFGFIGGYNSYVGPLIYLTKEKYYTLQIVVNQFASSYGNKYSVVCATALVALIPLIIVYVFCQKFFVQGIAATGLKS